MSFSWPPAGLHAAGSAASFVRLVGLEGRGSQACLNFYGVAVECPGPDTGIAEFSVALGAVAFDTSADYYTVRAWIDGPSLQGADCVESFAPTVGPCGANGLAYYDGVVEPTPWVRALGSSDPVGYGAQSNEYTATNAEGESGFVAQVDWPEEGAFAPTTIAYLVNPAPTWPVPDAHGNEFGMVLFTLAQLPAAISTTITYFSYDQPVGGRLWVSVAAYTEAEPPDPVRTRRGTIIGHA